MAKGQQVTQEQPQQGELSPVDNRSLTIYCHACPPLVISDSWADGKGDGEMITSIDTTTKEGRKVVMSSMMSNLPTLDAVLNTQICVMGCTLHPATKTDEESGEVFQLVRIVLHCHDGKDYQTFAKGVLKSLRIRQSFFGQQMFDPPAVCIPRRVPTSQSRAMFTLEWLD